MARSRFGGTYADWIFARYRFGNRTLLALNTDVKKLTFWDAEVDGNNYDDLLDADELPITSVLSVGYQIPVFYGPDAVLELWADDGDEDRHRMVAVDVVGIQEAAAASQAAAEQIALDKAAVEEARDETVAVGTTNDSIMAGKVNDDTSLTTSALQGLYARGDVLLDVRSKGAVGDGATDDTAAFQSALNTLQTFGGGTLIVPPLTFAVAGSAPLQLRSNVNIQGDGATLIKAASTFYAVFVALSQGLTGYGSGVKNVNISGLTFRGAMSPAAALCPFALHHAQNVTIERCTFDQVQHGGHTFDMGGCENITIRNNTWLGFNPASSPTAEAIQLDVSSLGAVSYTDTIGSFDMLFCRNIYVENNRFLPVNVGGTDYPCPNPLGSHTRVEGRYHENIHFTGNLVVDPAAAVSVSDLDNEGREYGVIHLPTVQGVVISGNTFRQSQARAARVISIHSMKYGALASSDPNTTPAVNGTWTNAVISKDITIRDNIFEGFDGNGTGTDDQEMIWLHGHSLGYIKNVTIEGNKFLNGYFATATTHFQASAIGAIYVDGLSVRSDFQHVQQAAYVNLCTNVRLNGCNVTDSAAYPAYFTGCGGVAVTGSSFNDYGRDLQTAGACKDVTISACTFRSPKLTGLNPGGIAIGGTTTGFTVTGNTVTNPGAAQARGILLGGSVVNGQVALNVIAGFTLKVSPASAGGTNVAYTSNI